MKKLSTQILAIAVLMIMASPWVKAQNLPDGAHGKPGFRASLSRTTTTFDATDPRGENGPDWTNGELSLPLPISSHITFEPRYRAENRTNIRHEITTDFTIRGNTPGGSYRVNADGAIGKPVISVRIGVRFYEGNTETRYGVSGMKIALPSSTRLTLGAGGYFSADTARSDIENFFGFLNWYSSNYLPNEPFSNPDGPVGFLAAQLRAGGSSDGTFGELRVLFPINPRTTVSGFVRGTRVTEPYERTLTFGASYALYPGISR